MFNVVECRILNSLWAHCLLTCSVEEFSCLLCFFFPNQWKKVRKGTAFVTNKCMEDWDLGGLCFLFFCGSRGGQDGRTFLMNMNVMPSSLVAMNYISPKGRKWFKVPSAATQRGINQWGKFLSLNFVMDCMYSDS